MFNLFRSRDKAVRILLGGLLVLVSLSMLTYLVPSYGSGGGGSSDIVVAEVGKDKILMPEVQKMIQMALRGQQLPPEFVPHYVPQIIQNMVSERAMIYEAKRLGFEVSDNDLASGIRAVIPSLFPDGKFVGKDAYAGYLAQQNMSIEEFETNMQRQLLLTRLRQVVLEGTVVSPQEVEQEFKKKFEKVKVEYVKIPTDKYKSDVKVTPEELRAYYDGHKSNYTTPEKRNLGILVISQEKIEAGINPNDADLLKLYNQNKEPFRTQDRVKVRHILLTTTGKSKDEEVAIKAKAENLLKQLRAGADFAKLAKENSQDPGSAAKGGELDWVTHGQTVPEFDKAAFALKPGEISDLVKTQYGYHIIQVEEKQSARLKPFEEVKPEMLASYKKGKASQELQALADKAEAALKKDPQHPDKVAADLGLEYVKADNVAPGDPLPQIGVNKDFDDSINGLKTGEVSQAIALPGSRVVMAVITGVNPAHPSSFEEVQAQVREAVTNEKVSKLVDQKARDLVEKAKSMNGDLAKAAKSMGMEVKTAADVTRTGAVEGLGSANYIAEAFSKPAGTILGPIEIPQMKAVVKVLGHVDADPSLMAAQKDTIREQLKSQKATERSKLFEAGLVDALTRDGKIKVHKDVVSRLQASFKG
jgi:peptidyl-prolyl cis-trans isomerase D